MGGEGKERECDLPLKSAGTRNFFLSISGMLDLGTFSTITWTERMIQFTVKALFKVHVDVFVRKYIISQATHSYTHTCTYTHTHTYIHTYTAGFELSHATKTTNIQQYLQVLR